MKTLLIIDAGLGQARAYMAKTLLGAAAPKAHLELIDNPNDAELVIVLGSALPTDSALNGKQVFLGDITVSYTHLRHAAFRNKLQLFFDLLFCKGVRGVVFFIHEHVFVAIDIREVNETAGQGHGIDDIVAFEALFYFCLLYTSRCV